MSIDGMDAMDALPWEERLVQLAYTMAVEPQQLRRLEGVLDTAIGEGVTPETRQRFDRVAPHIKAALDLMDRGGRRQDTLPGGRRTLREIPGPGVLLGSDKKIVMANDEARERLGVKEGDRLPRSLLETSDRVRLDAYLDDLDSLPREHIVAVFPTSDMWDGEMLRLSLSRANDSDGRSLAQLANLALKSDPYLIVRFSTEFALTPAETLILETMIAGETLGELAERRGRSLGTLRNQRKSLMRKLGVGGQLELLGLYASFAEKAFVRRGADDHDSPVWKDGRQSRNIPRKSGGHLAYDMYGPSGGTPVLFLHSHMMGTALSAATRKAIVRRNLRLIMPWRPFHAATDEEGGYDGIATRFAEDLVRLLDAEGLERVSVLGNYGGAIYAFALAQLAPDRVAELVIVNGAYPVRTKAALEALPPRKRLPYVVAELGPMAVELYVRAALAFADAGFDEDYLVDIHTNSPADMATLMNPEMQALAHAGMQRAYSKGSKAGVAELIVHAEDWSRLTDGLGMPVQMICGAQAGEVGPTGHAAMVARHPEFAYTVVPGTGGFLMVQKPDLIFGMLTGSK